MAEWLEQASQWHEYCHNQKVMGSDLGWVNLGVRSTSVQVVFKPIILQENECQAFTETIAMYPGWYSHGVVEIRNTDRIMELYTYNMSH